ncbi:NADH-quinone oxidoreductase subunit NuoN [Mycobacterium sp. M1]|uniref:NADH-quinone oxidoreductase subunit N n=1 Tax=Mycolicibacter acidiphilus TaxID=2835306 RepID=A0ABS5RHC1_9MYCO|nr:NADH-quinone oxidoreductase subunit NuoN [Mycolicibacter acidiphilus]MBS9533687.1 NADH-quinone oxidoreductase subunit NuoN [Mycolicibacter acidiphilus]
MSGIPTPQIEYALVAPLLIVFGTGVVGVLFEAFVSRRARYATQVVLAVGGLLAALATLLTTSGRVPAAGRIVVLGAVAVDRPALVLQGTLLVLGVMAVFFIAERTGPVAAPEGPGAAAAPVAAARAGLASFAPQASAIPGGRTEIDANRAGVMQTEVFPLTVLAVGGMMVFLAANDLVTMFVALEVLSLPLYLLCGLARHRRLLSQEAALKYFLLGAFSSALFLFGVALIYGATGSLSLPEVGAGLLASGVDSMTLTGAGLLLVGLFFKVGAVPFHSWIPDVYVGAPTPITGFMAAATKVAAFGAMLRILYIAPPALHDQWRPLLWLMSILTMLVGTVAAITQTGVKRMLAYSSISQVGFILTGVLAAVPNGISSTLFYLIAYSFPTVGAFAVISLIRRTGGEEELDMDRWGGLGRRYPVVGLLFSMFLLSFAGIPLTGGFIGKFAVFKAAAEGDAAPLVVIGVVMSAVAAYFYVRVIVLMFFTDAPDDPPHLVLPSIWSKASIALCAAVTVVLGILPQPALDLLGAATMFAR